MGRRRLGRGWRNPPTTHRGALTNEPSGGSGSFAAGAATFGGSGTVSGSGGGSFAAAAAGFGGHGTVGTPPIGDPDLAISKTVHRTRRITRTILVDSRVVTSVETTYGDDYQDSYGDTMRTGLSVVREIRRAGEIRRTIRREDSIRKVIAA